MNTLKFTILRFSPLRTLITPFLGFACSLVGAWAFYNFIAPFPEFDGTQTAYGVVALVCNSVSYAYLGWFIRERWAGFGWREMKTVEVEKVEDLPTMLSEALEDIQPDDE